MKKALSLVVLLSLGSLSQAATLTVNCYPDVNRSIEAAIPMWNKLHPDVDIKINTLAYPDHHNALTTALATGNGAGDVDCVEIGFVARFGESGGLEDLGKAPYNAKQYQKRVTGYAWAQATNADGGLYVFPVDIAPGTLFYRDDILKKAGVTPTELSKSWESYIDAGKRIKEKTGAYLLLNANFIALAYIRANIAKGESLFFDAKGQPLLNSPRFVKALQLAKMARDARIDANLTQFTPDWTDALNKGMLATQPFGAWFEGTMRALIPGTAGKWRAVDLPEKSYATWGGTFLAIPKQSKQKALAWEFIRFYGLNKDVQLNSFKAITALPALKAAQNDALFRKPVDFLGGQVVRPMWVRAANNTRPFDANRYDSVANDALGTAITRVLNSGVDVKTALDEAQALVERRVSRGN